MLKKTITYNDLDGNPVTEDFYFNLNKAEIAEMELSYEGGLSAHLQKVIETRNGAEVIAAFKNILVLAIGRRSEDNRRFVKSQEITQEFLETEAYSVLFMELVTNAESAANFIEGIMPPDMVAQLQQAMGTEDVQLPEEKEVPAYIRENRTPTKAELQAMSKEELAEAFRQKTQPAPDNVAQLGKPEE